MKYIVLPPFWGLLSGHSDDGVRQTWIRAYSASYEETWGVPPQPWEVYVSAVYWSAMTVTSIGYGEMLPENSAERIACTFFMLLSGMVWTYILSNAAGIAATLNPSAVLFQNTMCAPPSTFTHSLQSLFIALSPPRPLLTRLRDF